MMVLGFVPEVSGISTMIAPDSALEVVLDDDFHTTVPSSMGQKVVPNSALEIDHTVSSEQMGQDQEVVSLAGTAEELRTVPDPGTARQTHGPGGVELVAPNSDDPGVWNWSEVENEVWNSALDMWYG